MIWDGGAARRHRGRDAPAEDARAARNLAADAFYRMDRAQRDTRVSVDALVNLDPGSPVAQRVQADFAALNARADQLSAAYIGVLDANPVDEELPAAHLAAATRALGAVTADLAATADALAAFPARFAADLARLEQSLDQVSLRARAAVEALSAARQEVSRRTAEGLSSPSLARSLQAAEQAAAVLSRGAGGLGIAAAERQADTVVTLAERARAEAAELPRVRQHVQSRLVSSRTRAEAVGNRVSAAEHVLSELRRLYVEACSRPFADVPATMREQVAKAKEHLQSARASADAGDDAAAAQELARAVAALDVADARHSAVVERRDALAELSQDPEQRIAATRFAVRDAQRLVMAGRQSPPAHWAAVLDPLAARLDAAETLLDRARPDWWALLSELTAITDAVARVVTHVRAEQRG